MQQVLIGVDLGTTNTKVVAFSTSGEELAKASRSTLTSNPQPGWVEYDAEALWTVVCELLADVTEQLPDSCQAAAISVAGMAEAGVAIDAQGKPLAPAISWLDQRVTAELESWQDTIGADRTAQITGLPMNTAAGILRLLWLRNNSPDIYAQTTRWLNLPDFISFRLSSVATTDYSLASRMMVLDLASKQWSTELLNEIDVSPSIFGELVASGVQTGLVTAAASSETGLPKGLAVCSGGHDHLCAALGLGVTEPGEIFDSMGTAEAIVVTLTAPKSSIEIAKQGIAQGIHVVPDRYYALSGLYLSGGSIDWVRRILTSSLEQDLSNEQVYAALIDFAQSVAAGSDGLFFMPHLQQANSPVFDPDSRAAFIGLTSEAGPGHLVRAVLEGIAYEFQQLSDTVCKAFTAEAAAITAAGGGTRNGLLMDIKAALAGQSINVPEVHEATCLGAAVLAGIGVGIYSDVENAQSQLKFSNRIVECDIKLHEYYQKNYQEVYLSLYASLRKINHTIESISSDQEHG